MDRIRKITRRQIDVTLVNMNPSIFLESLQFEVHKKRHSIITEFTIPCNWNFFSKKSWL